MKATKRLNYSTIGAFKYAQIETKRNIRIGNKGEPIEKNRGETLKYAQTKTRRNIGIGNRGEPTAEYATF